MHDARSTHEWTNESHHEINCVIRRQNAQIPHAWPEWIPRGQCPALFQIILVREHASLGTATRARRINDAGHVLTLPHHEIRRSFTLEIFPAKSSRQVCTQR